MESEQHKKTIIKKPIIDFGRIFAAIRRRQSVYYKVIPTVVLVVWVITLGIPDYYKCKIELAPEDAAFGGSSSLSVLASTFGVNLGGSSQGSDAITVLFYPDVLNSTDFKTTLFNIKVKRKSDKEAMSYYDYLRDEQKEPWWVSARERFFELISGEEEKKPDQKVDPFELTPEQTAISGMINQKIVCTIGSSVAKQGSIITIEVTDQDPYVAATLADSVKTHLQKFLTDYKTEKARHDLLFTEKLYKESKRNYERARQLYVDFMDAHHDVVLENVRQKQTDLENDMQLLYNHYNAISSQLLAAKVRVQESTPAFTPLQSATVPLWPEGPNRRRLIVVFAIAAFFFTTIWVLYKENEIKPLLGLS